jgi:hypothetical protein
LTAVSRVFADFAAQMLLLLPVLFDQRRLRKRLVENPDRRVRVAVHSVELAARNLLAVSVN